ncbi:hypothetical protein C5E10_08720 [Pseudoclavibacter sp. RFBG4]|uniref:HAD hydrolase family protein n=2 Tax=unclassified Pseudoclavibacter TaxID=2615177 RepID=UPI000CE7D8F7|nr:hypothetical protein C5E10_08720 [Pseudoclavibacter sp. RFBG4]
MIGENKAYAILEYCVRNGVDPADCIAFGDHESDLPMLEAVGGGFWVRTSGEIEQHRPSVRT